MRFKKYLSLSAAFLLALGGFNAYINHNQAHDTAMDIPTKKFKSLPELSIKYDTVYITKEYLDTNKNINLGGFVYTTNTITQKYFVPTDTSSRARKFAETHNGEHASTLRHESEHGRKANLWADTKRYKPFVRGQIACMNEVMAAAGEVIESAENEWETNIPTVGPGQLKAATRAILAQNAKLSSRLADVDFTNQKIADIVLQYAIDRYIGSFNRGAYQSHVRMRMDSDKKWPEYTPNQECDPVAGLLFRPDAGKWDQLFEYKTKGGKKFNIWKSASQKMRDQVVARVDTAVSTLATPAEMPFFVIGAKNKN